MAKRYAKEVAGVLDTNAPIRAMGNIFGAKVKRLRGSFTTNGEPVGDTIELGEIPSGACFVSGQITQSASLGAATLAIGNANSSAKYRAAATSTAVDTPTPFGKASAIAAAPLAAPERIVATIGGGALPVGADLVIDIFYSDVA